MDNIILDKITVEGGTVWYDFSCDCSLLPYFKTRRMFIEYPHDVSSVPKSILSIPFIASIIGISWLENCNIYVPELDASYYYSLREAKASFQDMYYEAKLLGRVVPCKIVKNEIGNSENALLLFGGGVDAHCSFIRHKSKISHIINIQGWFNSLQDTDPAAEEDKKHCEVFACRENVNFIYVRSNFASFINSRYFERQYKSYGL